MSSCRHVALEPEADEHGFGCVPLRPLDEKVDVAECPKAFGVEELPSGALQQDRADPGRAEPPDDFPGCCV